MTDDRNVLHDAWSVVRHFLETWLSPGINEEITVDEQLHMEGNFGKKFPASSGKERVDFFSNGQMECHTIIWKNDQFQNYFCTFLKNGLSWYVYSVTKAFDKNATILWLMSSAKRLTCSLFCNCGWEGSWAHWQDETCESESVVCMRNSHDETLLVKDLSEEIVCCFARYRNDQIRWRWLHVRIFTNVHSWQSTAYR